LHEDRNNELAGKLRNMGFKTTFRGLDPTCGISEVGYEGMGWKMPGPLKIHNQTKIFKTPYSRTVTKQNRGTISTLQEPVKFYDRTTKRPVALKENTYQNGNS
jgi:hypothetical protein